MEQLNFYTRPFHIPKYGSWVYDAKGNFVFQFEFKDKELREKVIFSLNAIDYDPLKDLNLSIGTDPNEILNNNSLFITIRGWGNLTGIGANNFSSEKAAKIQDDFRDWIIQKISLYRV